MEGRSVFVLILLVVLSASRAAARTITTPSKSRRGLLDAAACTFNQDTPYPGSSRTFVVPMADALKCYSSILVTRSHAAAQVSGLKSFFNEYYAFTAIAKDPRAVPGASNISFGLRVYAEKVDLLGGLDAIMSSWADGDVPLDQVLFPVTHLFNSLHDGHVTYDQGLAFGNVLDSHYLVLWDKSKSTTVALKLKKLKDRSVLLAGLATPSCRSYTCILANDSTLTQVDSINGKSPVAWMASLVRDSVFDLYVKSVGNRLNLFMRRGYATSSDIAELGLFNRLGSDDISVQYLNGGTSSWAWYVDIPRDFPSNLTALGAQASSVGVPYQIQQNLTGIFNESATAQPAARRHLGTAAAAGVKLPKYWLQPGALVYNGESVVGTFGIKGEAGHSDYSAIFKLTTVDLAGSDLLDAWFRFVDLVNQQPVPPTKLIIDVSSNGGGDPGVSSLLAALLYPELLQPGNDFVFYTSDPRTVGPFAQYLISQGLLWDSVNASHTIPPPPDASKARATEISAAPALLAELATLTREWLDGVTEYLNSSASVGFDPTPSFLTSSLYGDVQDALSEIQNSSSLDADSFSGLVRNLFSIAGMSQPFGDSGKPSFFYVGDSSLPLYANDTLEQYVINKHKVTRTANYFDLTKQDFVDNVTDATARLEASGRRFPVHPFRSVLAVTDGHCGSACDLLVRVPWTYSRVNASAMPFKTVTFGGTGHEKDITATVFPGGNVEPGQYYAQQLTGQSTAWLYYSTMYTLSQWLGDAQLSAQLAGAKALIPAVPESLAYLPRFAFTNSFLPALNSGDVPNEYILLPPDHYIRQWYYLSWDKSLDRALYSSADQMALYDAVVKRF